MTALAMAVLLVGCEEFPGAATGSGTESAGTDNVLRVEERDVERPDIYEIEARGLWDGRPSLGGRWVAVAEDINADRVRITNLENDRTIEGALFKVEEGRPGPPIMVSSEAAEPLGMLPGDPSRLYVVVVRNETVEIFPEPADVEEPIGETGEDEGEAVVVAAAPAAEPVAPLDTGALETTVLGALDGTDATETPAPEPSPVAAAAEPEPIADAPTDPADQAELNALVATAAEPVGIGGDLKLPYIQVASGTDKAAIDSGLLKLNGEGYGARIRETANDDGTPFFRLVAGPFGNEGGRTNALTRIREMGYKDAFPTE